MKKILGMFLWLAISIALTGCITDYTPKEEVVELQGGETQVFKAVSDDNTAKLVWYLDGKKVAYGKTTYTYIAEQNSGDQIIAHTLTVREEGGKYVQFYKLAGLPRNFMPSVTWKIKVLPTGGPETYYQDTDGDTFGNPAVTQESETQPDGYVARAGDCDDTNDAINPDAAEVCNEIDDNCNGQIDEGVTQIFYVDVDNDTYGTDETVQACAAGPGLAARSGDCDNANVAINPGAEEIRGNDVDENCDGIIAGDLNTYYQDADNDTYGNPEVTQESETQPEGYVARAGDCDDTNGTINPDAAETCNAIDDNCNSQIDEGVTQIFYVDADNDTYGTIETVQACSAGPGLATLSGDCNDGNAAINPGVIEIGGNDVDENCDGIIAGDLNTYYQDADGDTYGNPAVTQESETQPEGYVARAGDCNDTNNAINPDATEACNELDDNCNGQIDEGVTQTFYVDGDNDTYGTDEAVQACAAGPGLAARSGDCNDANGAINPGAEEIRSNDVDENCDGIIAGDLTIYYQDADGDTYGNIAVTQESEMQPEGYVSRAGDCNDTNNAINPGAAEACNQIDDNCNGQIDEGVTLTLYVDDDGDTYGTDEAVQACAPEPGFAARSGDCNDANAAINPGAEEIRGNDVDENCDGIIAGDLNVYYQDADEDTFGNPAVMQESETQPDGYVARAGDCNDANKAINPDAVEACNLTDDNCNGQTDEGVTLTFYVDGDSDGYGSDEAVQACTAGPGLATQSGDCNDSAAAVNPGAAETCNQADDNCNGQIDEGVTQTFYVDGDSDGYGTSETVQACAAGPGLATQSGDCNDSAAAVNPGAAETCNQADDNCNGQIDEGVTQTFYVDGDSDGYGTSETVQACAAGPGLATQSGDCNDGAAAVNPGAAETCNQADDNCNGQIDEGVTQTFYVDGDSDGYGTSETVQACAAGPGLATQSGDCNDGAAAVNPGAAETCNQADDNCNGQIDEGVTQTFYVDGDSDGYGTSETVQACAAGPGLATQSGDCNDGAAAVNPGAAETCNQADDNCNGQIDEGVTQTFYVDGDSDGYGTSETVQACAAGPGLATQSGDCNDGAAAVNPGADENCDNDIDDNCNGGIDDPALDGCPPDKLDAPVVNASDKSSGLTNIQVTWEDIEGATYYNVYRAIWEEDATYELVADHVEGTSYDYVQNWATVAEEIGSTPAMAPSADCAARATFTAALNAYRDNALPYLFDFKAPAFFKVEACNAQGCSDQSAPDAGQAEYIHTDEFSEVAEIVIPSWGYATLVALADSPPGGGALSWCGIDICGAGGGMVMGRLDQNGLPMVDVYFENYTEAWEDHPNALFTTNGWLGGQQPLVPALSGVISVSGEFDIVIGEANFHIFMYTYIGGTTGNPNTGYVTVTYNNESYQFTLPVQPLPGQLVAAPPAPVDMDDAAHVVATRATSYPVPFDVTAPVSGCLHCGPIDPANTECARIIEPQPTRP